MKLFLILVLLSFNTLAKIKIHGHRGARAVLPENTLSAIKYVVENKIDIIEFDLASTKDGVLVLAHDGILNSENCTIPKKYQGQPVPYYSITSKEVMKIDCGKNQPKKYPKQKALKNEKIPSLRQVLTYLNKVKYQGMLNIETKLFPGHPEVTPTPQKFARLLNDELKRYHDQSKVIVQSFDYRSLVSIQKLNKNVKTSLLTYANLLPLVEVFKVYKFNYWSPHHRWMTKQMILNLEKIGVETHPWTLNSPKDWDRAIKMGVHGIITDDPVALQSYLKK
tara:strand:- start:100778 stop:101614 length:837 start_codon:yes stop_codon:yes gene_type:complete